MALEIISIGSSSAGNSYIVKAGNVNLLLDVGLSCKAIVAALGDCGLAPEDVHGVLITHEHGDHVKSVRAIAKKCCNAEFFASRGTIAGTPNFAFVPEERINIVDGDTVIEIGETRIDCFDLSHDAREPIGYSIAADGERVTVITDTGIVTDRIFNQMLESDVLVFEANHELELLMMGPYPYSTKQRIKGDYGHLSNVTSAGVLAEVLERKNRRNPEAMPSIMLAHLSDTNNSPYQAKLTVVSMLEERGWHRDEHYKLTVASREGLTFME